MICRGADTGRPRGPFASAGPARGPLDPRESGGGPAIRRTPAESATPVASFSGVLAAGEPTSRDQLGGDRRAVEGCQAEPLAELDVPVDVAPRRLDGAKDVRPHVLALVACEPLEDDPFERGLAPAVERLHEVLLDSVAEPVRLVVHSRDETLRGLFRVAARSLPRPHPPAEGVSDEVAQFAVRVIDLVGLLAAGGEQSLVQVHPAPRLAADGRCNPAFEPP